MNHKDTIALSLSFCSNMRTICSPLNRIGIDYASYTRVYRDGRRAYLSTREDVVELTLTNTDYVLPCANETHPDNYPGEQMVVWSTLPNQIHYRNVADRGIKNGIYLFTGSNDEYYESFGFATSTGSESIINQYANNLNLIKLFTDKFKDKTVDIIHKLKQFNFILPFNNIKTPNYHSLELEKSLHPNFLITRRERECAYLFLAGLSAKEIAKEINLSFRTVEHYLQHLKERLKCKNKIELAVKLYKLLYKQ